MTHTSEQALDRIAQLAQALAQSTDTNAKQAMRQDYLDAVGDFLTAQGRGAELAFPLLDIVEQLEATTSAKPVDRRLGVRDCNDELLAQVAAVIDVLVQSGYSSDHASQLVTRQLIARGVRIPSGGDARAWRNIQAWRHKFINSRKDGELWRHYLSFKEELAVRYGARLAEAAAREGIWDRRHP